MLPTMRTKVQLRRPPTVLKSNPFCYATFEVHCVLCDALPKPLSPQLKPLGKKQLKNDEQYYVNTRNRPHRESVTDRNVEEPTQGTWSAR